MARDATKGSLALPRSKVPMVQIGSKCGNKAVVFVTSHRITARRSHVPMGHGKGCDERLAGTPEIQSTNGSDRIQMREQGCSFRDIASYYGETVARTYGAWQGMRRKARWHSRDPKYQWFRSDPNAGTRL